MNTDNLKTTDAGAAGDVPPPGATPSPAPQSPPQPSPSLAQPGAAPPAANLVLNGSVSEETEHLRQTLAEAQRTIRERETRVSELEDENLRLKTPEPIPVRKKKPDKVIAFPWMRPRESEMGGE